MVNEKNKTKISFLTFFSSLHILGFVFLLRWVLSSNKFLVFKALCAQSHGWGPANKSNALKKFNLSLLSVMLMLYGLIMLITWRIIIIIIILKFLLSLSVYTRFLGFWGGPLNRSLSSLSLDFLSHLIDETTCLGVHFGGENV